VTTTAPATERWTFSWKHLHDEVLSTGLCTGCAGCVIACPHDVLGYDDTNGVYRPLQLETNYGGADACSHGDKACTSCTRACPRFRAWEPEIDQHLFGRARRSDEVSGVLKDVFLARATDPVLHAVGQDGGLVSAMLVYALEHDLVDAALVSYLDGEGTWKAKPGVARTRADVIASAGSRYTYSANPLAYLDLGPADERVALVGMSCQSSVPPAMRQRKAGKAARRLALTIGLLCSKTFDDAIFDELLEPRYGLRRADITKMNIKGRLQVWANDGRYVEVPLKECQPFTREGCKLCPDFSAEHADVSTGGIGAFDDWTLTIVRTDAGRDLIARMVVDGWIETRPGDDDPDAIALMHKLSAKSRKRWPETAHLAPRRVAPPGPTPTAAPGNGAGVPGDGAAGAGHAPALRVVTAPAEALLGSDALAHVVTMNRDGTPQVSVVWCSVHGDEIRFIADGRSAKVRNLRRDPSIVLSIEDEVRNLAGRQHHLVVRGRATIVEGPPDPALCDALCRTYVGTSNHPLNLRDSPTAVTVTVGSPISARTRCWPGRPRSRSARRPARRASRSRSRTTGPACRRARARTCSSPSPPPAAPAGPASASPSRASSPAPMAAT
jgi:coenzyme F420 hydrogenase subunit beta